MSEQAGLLDHIRKASEGKLSQDFVIELINCMFHSQKIFDISKQHLKYHYLQSEPQKKVVKYIFDLQDVQKAIPTIGMVGQAFASDKEVISLLGQIKKSTVTNDQHESILSSFEEYIRKSRFIALYTKVGELFNQGKQDEAISVLDKESTEISAFALRQTYYTRIFGDYNNRAEKRKIAPEKVLSRYCIWGIHELDDYSGGLEYGRSALLMGRSGGGKSTAMKWIGLANARIGKRVVHIQAEGSLMECETAYDAAWTGTAIDDLEFGNIPSNKQLKIQKAHRDILGNNGEIYVYAAEQFDSLSVSDVREILLDIEKIYGKIDLVLWDYLPKFTITNHKFFGEHAERQRRLAIGDKITNIAVEFNCACVTAVQADNVLPAEYNKADFVMRRSNISENKSQTEPFSYFITLNQTDDELEAGIIRLYCDKMRKRKPGKLIRIYTAMDRARFYDSVKTLQTFYNKAA